MRKNEVIGVALILGDVLVSSGKEVYLGSLLQTIDPLLVLFYTFAIVMIFFCLVELRRFPAFIGDLKTHRPDFIGLNLFTIISWGAFFYALKFVEPAITDAVAFAVVPIATLALTPLLRKSHKPVAGEIFAALGMTAGILLLTYTSIVGLSGLGKTQSSQALWGIGFCALAGLGLVGVMYFQKSLSDKGVSSSTIIAGRFFILLFLCIPFLPRNAAGFHLELLQQPLFLLLAVGAGQILALYLFQSGLRLCEPLTVSLILATAPLFTFGVQIFDPRLSLSWVSLVGISLCVCSCAAGVYARLSIREKHSSSA